jgi:uncharacterized protein
MIGKLSEQQVEQLLHEKAVGRIGCCADNMPYVVPISYAYDGTFIYGHTREGMKISMMRKNPVVCFEVDELKDFANWRSVITWGRFEELKEQPEREEALKNLVERMLPLVTSETMHLSIDSPFPPKDINSIKGIVFRIRLHHKTGRYEINSVGTSHP